MFLLIAIYLMKFATDVLGMSAAVMGMILFLGRGVWDAIADPIAGYLSDRTNTRMGRRRPWLLASAIPLGVTFVLLWMPPRDLSPDAHDRLDERDGGRLLHDLERADHSAHRARCRAHRQLPRPDAHLRRAAPGLDDRLLRRDRRLRRARPLGGRAHDRVLAGGGRGHRHRVPDPVDRLAHARARRVPGPRRGESVSRVPRRLAEPARAPAPAGVRHREPGRGDDRRADAVRRAVRGEAARHRSRR